MLLLIKRKVKGESSTVKEYLQKTFKEEIKFEMIKTANENKRWIVFEKREDRDWLWENKTEFEKGKLYCGTSSWILKKEERERK